MFQDFNLNPAILKAIDELGFKEPMPIQAEVLPVLLSQRTDLVVRKKSTSNGVENSSSTTLLSVVLSILVSCQPSRKVLWDVSSKDHLLVATLVMYA